MRDDALLNSGMSSAIDRRQAYERSQKQRERETKRSQLTPGAEIILEWIDQEKRDVCNLEKIILHIGDKELLRDELMARQLHLNFLNKLKAKAQNLLRTLPESKPTGSEAAFLEAATNE